MTLLKSAELDISLWQNRAGFRLPSAVEHGIREFLGAVGKEHVYFCETCFDKDTLEGLSGELHVEEVLRFSGLDGLGPLVEVGNRLYGRDGKLQMSCAGLSFCRVAGESKTPFVLAHTKPLTDQNYLFVREGRLAEALTVLHGRATIPRYFTGGSYGFEPGSPPEFDETQYVFSPDTIKTLLANTVGFLTTDRLDRYRDLKLIPKRGVLVYGPPGTGKTSLSKLVAREALNVGTNVFHMEYGLLRRSHGSFSTLLREALRHEPVILIFDDIDLFLGKRDFEQGHNVLGDFLHFLDGVDSEQGFVALATTNHLTALDSALLRPGRFDCLLRTQKPTRDEMAEACRRLLLLDGEGPATDDMPDVGEVSFADVAEISRRYKVHYIESGKSPYAWDASVFAGLAETYAEERASEIAEMRQEQRNAALGSPSETGTTRASNATS